MTGISRRQILKGSAQSILGMALSYGIGTTATAAASDLPQSAKPAPPLAVAKRSNLLDPTGPLSYEPLGPLSLAVSHVLSDDFFMTTDVRLNVAAPGATGVSDVVQPLVRADGRNEALVLSVADQMVYHLRRDTSASSGWAYESITLAGGPLFDTTGILFATVSNMTANCDPVTDFVHVFLMIDATFSSPGDGEQPITTIRAGHLDASDTYAVDLGWGFGPDKGTDPVVMPVMTGNDQGNNPFFYTFGGSGFWVFAVSGEDPPAPTYFDITRNPGMSGIMDFRVALLTGFYFAWCVDTNGKVWQWVTSGISWQSSDIALAYNTGFIGSAQTYFDQTVEDDYRAVVLGTGTNGGLYMISSLFLPTAPYTAAVMVDGDDNPVSTATNAAVRTNVSASQLYMLGSDNNLYTQVPVWDPTNTATVGTSPVAIETGLAGLYVATQLTWDTTLFVVDVGGYLSVLTRSQGLSSTYQAPGSAGPDLINPAAGPWKLINVTQGAATGQKIDTWRTTFKLTDNAGVALQNQPVTIQVDTDIEIWQPLTHFILSATDIDANGAVVKGAGTVFITDYEGVITFATPAVTLHSANYTISTSDLTWGPFAPDAAVHSFLGGNSSALDPNNTQALTDSLQSATKPDVAPLTPSSRIADDTPTVPLFPTLQNNPGDATALANFMTNLIAVGSNPNLDQGSLPLPGATGGTSMTLAGIGHPNGLRLTMSDLPPVAGTPDVDSLGSVWSDFKNDAESVLHAIERGVLKLTADVVKGITLTASAVDGITTWVVSLAIEGIEDGVSWVVTCLKDAVTALTSVFNKLEADVLSVLRWLKHALFGFLADVNDAADQLLTLLDGNTHGSYGPASDSANNQITTYLANLTTLEQGFFEAKIGALQDTIGTAGATYGTSSITDIQGTYSSANVNADLTTVGSIGNSLSIALHDVKAAWLKDKVKGATVVDDNGYDACKSAFNQLFSNTQSAWAQFESDVNDVAYKLYSLLSVTGQDSDSVQQQAGSSPLQNVFDAMDGVAADLLKLADIIVTDFIAMMKAAWEAVVGLLGSPISDFFPFLAEIFSFVGIGDFTVGKVVALLVTFPGTILAKVKHGTSADMFASQSGPSNNLSDFMIEGALVAAFEWGLLDLANDAFDAGAKSAGQDYEPPALVNWFNIGFAVFANLLSFPFSNTAVDASGDVDWSASHSDVAANLPLDTWAVGFAPATLQFLTRVLRDIAGVPVDVIEDVNNVLQTLLGLALTGMNIAVSVDPAETSPDLSATQAVAVVGNLTTALSLLSIASPDNPAGFIANIVKLGFDAACPAIVVGADIAILLQT